MKSDIDAIMQARNLDALLVLGAALLVWRLSRATRRGGAPSTAGVGLAAGSSAAWPVPAAAIANTRDWSKITRIRFVFFILRFSR